MSGISEQDLIEGDIHAFLDHNETKELLRFVTVGSVDDGKSTLIGRLLHDTKGVYDDQLADAVRTTQTGEQAIDFALITDGLRAEREQGITIDVAYRYFSTPARKFIIADTPGHVQYTRNMATGASTADVAIILIDARYGVLQQSMRHAYIASLLGIPHLLVCINKMDLVDYDRETYDKISEHFNNFVNELAYGTALQRRVRGAGQCAAFASVTFVPCSALMGINIVERSEERTPWYGGPTVLSFLETVPIGTEVNHRDFRFPVQYVIRPHLDYRGYAGQVVSGAVRPGDRVTVMPSGKSTVVEGIDVYEGELEVASSPLSVTIRLRDEIDISRGDMLVHQDNLPLLGRHFDAMVVWMSETPLDADRSYVIKHTTRYVRTNIDKVVWEIDLETLTPVRNKQTLELNSIGLVSFTTHRPVAFDAYRRNRATGAFIIIDSMTNNTVGAGMMVEPEDDSMLEGEFELGAGSQVSLIERARRLGHKAATVWLTGQRREVLAYTLERRLFDLGYLAVVVDDIAGPTAARFNDAGIIAICVGREGADSARVRVGAERFLHVADADATDDGLDASVETVIARLTKLGVFPER